MIMKPSTKKLFTALALIIILLISVFAVKISLGKYAASIVLTNNMSLKISGEDPSLIRDIHIRFLTSTISDNADYPPSEDDLHPDDLAYNKTRATLITYDKDTSNDTFEVPNYGASWIEEKGGKFMGWSPLAIHLAGANDTLGCTCRMFQPGEVVSYREIVNSIAYPSDKPTDDDYEHYLLMYEIWAFDETIYTVQASDSCKSDFGGGTMKYTIVGSGHFSGNTAGLSGYSYGRCQEYGGIGSLNEVDTYYLSPGNYAFIYGLMSSFGGTEYQTTVGFNVPHHIYEPENVLGIDQTFWNGGESYPDGKSVVDIYLYNEGLKEESSGGNCFASDTLITLSDGRRVPIEDVSPDDTVLVYDHEQGMYVSAPITFIENDGVQEYNVINLVFSNGQTTKIIYEHGLFDLTLNKYVYIDEYNCEEYIGHRFACASTDGAYGELLLEDAFVKSEITGCYSMTTAYHINYFIDGLFSVPGGIEGLFNFFEYGDGLAYDTNKMQADIEKYGLFTYDDFKDYVSYEVFEYLFPTKYLKISIGKGLMSYDDIIYLIERYVYGHDLNQIN